MHCSTDACALLVMPPLSLSWFICCVFRNESWPSNHILQMFKEDTGILPCRIQREQWSFPVYFRHSLHCNLLATKFGTLEAMAWALYLDYSPDGSFLGLLVWPVSREVRHVDQIFFHSKIFYQIYKNKRIRKLATGAWSYATSSENLAVLKLTISVLMEMTVLVWTVMLIHLHH